MLSSNMATTGSNVARHGFFRLFRHFVITPKYPANCIQLNTSTRAHHAFSPRNCSDINVNSFYATVLTLSAMRTTQLVTVGRVRFTHRSPALTPKDPCVADTPKYKTFSGYMAIQRYSGVSHHQQTSSDIQKLIDTELSFLPSLIQKELTTEMPELRMISRYYFDGKGKLFRPMVILLIAITCNLHSHSNSQLAVGQRDIAMIAEMIHTASLIHDDIIDKSDTRRGKPSTSALWGQQKATLAGDYILSVAGMILARINNDDVVTIITQIIDDLVRGEFMQLGNVDNDDQRFAHYLRKTFRKTASLLANGCKAVAILGNCGPDVTRIAYEYGRNLGIAFQLIDDVLDFVSTDSILGKPVAVDLKLGLATAPVLFACQQYPELNTMISRDFVEEGDPERARQLVVQSDGISQTRFMAEKYSIEATNQISSLANSPSKDILVELCKIVLSRDK